MFETQKMIGELNGKWALLFKSVLTLAAVTLPLVVTLNVWFVQKVYSMESAQVLLAYKLDQFIAGGPRWTAIDAKAAHLELKQEIETYIESRYPPRWLTDTVSDLDTRVKRLEGRQ